MRIEIVAPFLVFVAVTDENLVLGGSRHVRSGFRFTPLCAEPSGLDFPGRIRGQDSSPVVSAKHPFQVCGSGTFIPDDKLLDCLLVGGPPVRLPDRDREELEEIFRIEGRVR